MARLRSNRATSAQSDAARRGIVREWAAMAARRRRAAAVQRSGFLGTRNSGSRAGAASGAPTKAKAGPSRKTRRDDRQRKCKTAPPFARAAKRWATRPRKRLRAVTKDFARVKRAIGRVYSDPLLSELKLRPPKRQNRSSLKTRRN